MAAQDRGDARQAPRSRAQAVAAYEKACAKYGDAPYPADDARLADQIEGFSVDWVKRGRSHISLHGYLLCLFKHLRLANRPLPPHMRARLIEKYAELARRYPATVTRAQPLTGGFVDAVGRHLAPHLKRGAKHALLIMALLALGVRGKFRGGELLRAPWAAFGVAPDGKHLAVWMMARKNNKTTRSAQDLVTVPSSGGHGDPLAAMRRLALAHGRTLPPIGQPPAIGHDGPLAFTPLFANGTPCTWAPGRWLNRELRRLAALVRLPTPPMMGTSMHGMRRGGAHDELSAGVSEAQVRIAGRWKSEAGFAPYSMRDAAIARTTTSALMRARASDAQTASG